jgi:hypothetical protein
MILAGCDNPAGESDTWTDVTSLDQMNGTWQGSFSQARNMKELMEEMDDESGMSALFEGVTVTINLDMTVTINANTKTLTGTMIMKQAFSGDIIDYIWPVISESLSEEPNTQVDEANHSVTMTTAIDEILFDINDMGDYQINQHGTKIKILMPEDVTEFFQDFEITFNRV